MGREFELPAPVPLPSQTGASFAKLVELMQRLLAPDGCPWDREQTYASLRPYVIEEASEVVDAIDAGAGAELCEELGDLTLQVVFLAELARRDGRFGPDDVIRSICEKLVRRHPHVFGEADVSGPDEVTRNWEAIKQTEKKGRRLLDGIPKAFPALSRAHRIGEKARRVGFDWTDGEGSRRKVSEELDELDDAIRLKDRERIQAELGDLLFALVNLARHHDIDAETALRESSDRFCRRFGFVEDRVRESIGDWPRDEKGKPTRGPSLEQLDAHWNEAKRRGL